MTSKNMTIFRTGRLFLGADAYTDEREWVDADEYRRLMRERDEWRSMQQREIERLTRELAASEQRVKDIDALWHGQRDVIAERDRMRAALERISSRESDAREIVDQNRWPSTLAIDLTGIARMALSGEPTSPIETTANPRAQELFGALLDFLNQWKNRGETTSLHEWHQRMKAAAARAESVLNAERIHDCCNDECKWSGTESETVHPKHDPNTLLCPECHEVTEPSPEKASGEPWRVGDTWHCRCGAANTAERCTNCKRARADEWGDGRAENGFGD